MLTAIRRRLKIAKKENAYSTYGTGEDVTYCFYDCELAEWLNSTREEILKILSSICKEAGLRKLHFRKHRHRWQSKTRAADRKAPAAPLTPRPTAFHSPASSRRFPPGTRHRCARVRQPD